MVLKVFSTTRSKIGTFSSQHSPQRENKIKINLGDLDLEKQCVQNVSVPKLLMSPDLSRMCIQTFHLNAANILMTIWTCRAISCHSILINTTQPVSTTALSPCQPHIIRMTAC